MAENYTKTKARIMVYQGNGRCTISRRAFRSIHLACSRDGKNYEALNNNYGILFAEAAVDDADIIHARGKESHGFCNAGGRLWHCCRQGQ
ncbi:MAG: hypothetical protein ACLVAW_19175 [Eisenbergiella massiliensis]